MPYNVFDVRSRVIVAKAATIADWLHLDTVSGTWSLDAQGVSAAAGTSNVIGIFAGGFDDQLITADLRTTTAAGSESFGVIVRFMTFKSPDATYYYARQVAGEFRIQKIVSGTFTTLTSTAFTITSSTWYTFTLQVVGDALTATIDDGAGNSASLSATDSAIAGPGGFGFRSGPTNSTQISCRSFQVEEV